MDPSQLALVQGLRDTRNSLERWNANPARVLLPWLAGALAIACALLLAVWGIASLNEPDPTTTLLPGLNLPVDGAAIGHILFRNSLVLLLHALACVAGFIAGSSLPLQAEHKSGVSKWVHEQAGPFAIAFVTLATLFSLFTQAMVLGGVASDLANQLDISTGDADPDAAPARGAGARRAVPPARRVARRLAPRPVGRAAGGYVRDGRDRRSDARRDGLHRGLGLARPDARGLARALSTGV